ncbi:MAG: hypothetical protein IT259_03830 [Saprospiraceae bacterium]|nr:hypothetical protein [Saprospiraceae bacterium]
MSKELILVNGWPGGEGEQAGDNGGGRRRAEILGILAGNGLTHRFSACYRRSGPGINVNGQSA